MIAMPLAEYIVAHHDGSQSDLARAIGVNRQQITKWLNDGWIVVDGKLYSPRRNVSASE